MIKKVICRIRHAVWKVWRKKRNRKNQQRLSPKAKTATILSANCTGGILSHDLGLRFLSPTINLFMRAEDFIKFCEHLDDYLKIEHFAECKDRAVIGNRTYPIAYLGDITLFLVHYHSVQEAEKKWNERKIRVNWDNIVVLCNDREGMTECLKDRFEKLPYKKVMFTHLPDAAHKSSFYLKGYENQQCVGIVTEEKSWFGKRPVDQFDYVRLLND